MPTAAIKQTAEPDNGLDLLNVGLAAQHDVRWQEPLELYSILEWSGALLMESPKTHEKLQVPQDLHSIVLEHWRIWFERRPDDSPLSGDASMGEFSKNAKIIIRTIYSLTRLLPAFSMMNSSLSISVRRAEEMVGLRGTVKNLEDSIMGESGGGAFEASSLVQLVPLITPHGSFHFSVRYRKRCKFSCSNSSNTVGIAKVEANTNLNDPNSFENVELEAVSPPRNSPPGTLKARSKSMQAVTSPLANPQTIITSQQERQRRRIASSPSTGAPHSKSGSSLAEDSQLAAFIKELDRRPSIEPIIMSIPPTEELRERYEQAKSWLRAQLRNHETRSKLIFSPLMERHDEQQLQSSDGEAQEEPIIFDFDRR